MSKTILIVENDVLSMKLLNALLQYNGYDTINSIDGSNILAIAQERSLDLIIMDIKLPVLSGLELTRMLKRDEELKKIPIIAVTALAMIGDRENILIAGCDAYLSKPISIPKFIATVREYLS